MDTRKDLNAYTAIEGQAGCCAPVEAASSSPSGLTVLGGSCSPGRDQTDVYGGLAALLAKYDVNAFAASVRVFAVKP